MKRIFVDTNVIIDVLMQREGFLASAKVLSVMSLLLETRKILYSALLMF